MTAAIKAGMPRPRGEAAPEDQGAADGIDGSMGSDRSQAFINLADTEPKPDKRERSADSRHQGSVRRHTIAFLGELGGHVAVSRGTIHCRRCIPPERPTSAHRPLPRCRPRKQASVKPRERADCRSPSARPARPEARPTPIRLPVIPQPRRV